MPFLSFKPIVKPVAFGIFCALTLMFGHNLNAANVNYCSQAKMIVNSAEAFHVMPRALDDSFATLVFDELMETLDPAGLIFSQEEVQELLLLKDLIDDEIKDGSCGFLQEITSLYTQKLNGSLAFLKEYKTQPLYLNKPETAVERDTNGRVKSASWRANWEQWLKIEIMEAYIRADSSSEMPLLSSDKIEQAQHTVADQVICTMQGRLNQKGALEEYVGSRFLKAVATAYDPHTEYFTLAEEEEFENMLSTDALSFGFEIASNENGEMEIYKIIPGSPAWKSNSINEGDIVLSMETPEGMKENFVCRSLSEINLLLGSEEVKDANFRIRKKNGKEIELELQKDEVNVEENVIRSFILTGERKIGYIYLPAFYTPMNGMGNSAEGCAADVAKELIKLKKEGIEGLILDLRDNGGGSVWEAVNLSGIFIDYGAVCIAAGRENSETLKDPFRGQVYRDPMVIMINGFSASSSELFAAAMQDQNRAVLVGSNTFGKSTMQTILPIDAYKFKNQASYKPEKETSAYIKITSSTFYRVDGKSHQGMGVVPDVELPDLYAGLLKNESGFPTALKLEPIQKKTYYFPGPELPLTKLKKLSSDRVSSDSAFFQIIKLNQYFQSLNEKIEPLDFPTYWNNNYGEDIIDLFGFDFNIMTGYEVQNPSYLQGLSSMEDSNTEINSRIMNDIATDLYIEESYQILNDLINLSKN